MKELKQVNKPSIFKIILSRLLLERYFYMTHSPVAGDFGYFLSFDVEYSQDVKSLPKLISILKKYDVKASFAVIGKMVERYPGEHQLLKDGNFEVFNHSYTHPFHDELKIERGIGELDESEVRAEIQNCHGAVKKHLGIEMTGWRTPHFGCQIVKNIYKLLKELGYTYSSSTCDYNSKGSVPFNAHGITEFPITSTSKYPLLIFDSWNYRSCAKPALKTNEEFLALWEDEMLLSKKNNFFCNHYFDPAFLLENDIAEKMCQFLKREKIKTSLYSAYAKR